MRHCPKVIWSVGCKKFIHGSEDVLLIRGEEGYNTAEYFAGVRGKIWRR
jgi:hypothetical protein